MFDSPRRYDQYENTKYLIALVAVLFVLSVARVLGLSVPSSYAEPQVLTENFPHPQPAEKSYNVNCYSDGAVSQIDRLEGTHECQPSVPRAQAQPLESSVQTKSSGIRRASF